MLSAPDDDAGAPGNPGGPRRCVVRPTRWNRFRRAWEPYGPPCDRPPAYVLHLTTGGDLVVCAVHADAWRLPDGTWDPQRVRQAVAL